jgi:NAD(P)-dependent dehydrogenase (short-subunit alcohol dehydrogenase family)
MGATRVLVVGASSGVGKAIAQRFVRSGASVAFSARRVENLTEAIAEVGGGIAVPGDVRAHDGAVSVVEAAAEALGGIDVLIYATGVSPLRRLRDANREQWTQVLETNVVGLHEVVQAALPHLSEGAAVGVLSSDSVGTPRPGLVPYAASKAALEELMRGWRAEHPEIRFSTIVIGPTFPTEFGSHFDPELMGELWGEWERLGIADASIMDGNELADVIVSTYQTLLGYPGITMQEIILRPAKSPASEFDREELFAEQLADTPEPSGGGA